MLGQHFLIMKTATKLKLMRTIMVPIWFLRSSFGWPMAVRAERLGLQWELDLREAIDACLYVTGSYEPELVKYYRREILKGSVVLDIGANRGAHTFPLAQAVGIEGTIYAIEATGFGMAKLREQQRLNPEIAARVRPSQLFLGDSAEPISAEQGVSASWDISLPVGDSGRNILDGGYSYPVTGAEPTTLDAWVAREKISRIDLVKLDVDGNEVIVLRGAQKTLRHFRPKLLMELSPIHYRDAVPGGPTFREQIELVFRAGYRLETLGGRRLPSDSASIEAMIPWGTLVNVVGIPR